MEEYKHINEAWMEYFMNTTMEGPMSSGRSIRGRIRKYFRGEKRQMWQSDVKRQDSLLKILEVIFMSRGHEVSEVRVMEGGARTLNGGQVLDVNLGLIEPTSGSR